MSREKKLSFENFCAPVAERQPRTRTDFDESGLLPVVRS
jgi:hypothetical protein